MSLVGLLDYFDRKQGREDYGNLLNEYRVPGDPNTPNPGPYALGSPEMNQAQQQQFGGFKGAGGLVSGGPPPEFYMRAGGLPGYQALASQAQTGQQAMERQMQGQQWSMTNMPLAQKTELDMRQSQQTWERDRRQFEWNNPSAAQQANIDQGWASNAVSRGNLAVNQAQLGLQQQKFQFEQGQAERAAANPFNGLKPGEKIEFMDRVGTVDRAANVATDLIDYYNRSGTGEITMSPIDRNTLGTEWQGAMLPYLQQRFQAGAMQKGEQELFQELAGDPAKIMSLKGKQLDLFKLWATDIQQTRERLYGYAGVKAPQTRSGQSAFAKSRTAPSAPNREDLTPWGP